MINTIQTASKLKAGLPVLDDRRAYEYVANGALPDDLNLIPAPADVALVGRGFWLVPTVRAHESATVFLIADKAFSLTEQCDFNEKPACFYDNVSGNHFIGYLANGELTSMVYQEFPDMPVENLSFVGRVIAGI